MKKKAPASGIRPSVAKELERITDSFGKEPDEDPDDTPLPTIDGRGGILLKRDACRNTEEDRPTGRSCPQCAQDDGSPGDGILRSEDDRGRYKTSVCPLCRGFSWVSEAVATEYQNLNRKKANGN